ncbi:hypothetical protein GCM10011371_03340 [Novosphingobium marinum]|uniref:EthD domain-containing protein n=1 Tax=Novosphingobium marinum TaxID=1514948 RepID=A0A7Z0BRP0_9SPHN|nr:hypothetical protein [Novosphingobium marinum]NYH94026.1 hypothetical protein [Novosphingobium marinum]GGC19034.1 hypothetical protein GCM10011371_03340 [Novosphingobium marinum]
MRDAGLESILVVYQNPLEGRLSAYDDWYTNVHIRDAMRLDGAIATQRFAVHALQPTIEGQRVTPRFWAHTIYEWESAAASVQGHSERAGTELMQITGDASFTGLRDFFFRPEHLSHGWEREAGFRGSASAVMTALLEPAGDPDDFAKWFASEHAPHTTSLPGIGSASLFSLHEEQSLPVASEFPLVAVYGLSDAAQAIAAWSERHAAGDPNDLGYRTARYEIGCWEPRTPRLMARDVLSPSPAALAEETRARAAYADRYLATQQLEQRLASI